METDCTAHHIILASCPILCPKIIKVSKKNDEVLTKTIERSFLRHGVHRTIEQPELESDEGVVLKVVAVVSVVAACEVDISATHHRPARCSEYDAHAGRN